MLWANGEKPLLGGYNSVISIICNSEIFSNKVFRLQITCTLKALFYISIKFNRIIILQFEFSVRMFVPHGLCRLPNDQHQTWQEGQGRAQKGP